MLRKALITGVTGQDGSYLAQFLLKKNEAMAMQTPIVSTDVGDMPIYVKEGCNGFVADVGDW